MPQSPMKESADPMVGAAGSDASKNKDIQQHTDAEQRSGDSQKEAPGSAGGLGNAVKVAQESVQAMQGEGGGQTRKEAETGTKSA